jgi:hypothetical protein
MGWAAVAMSITCQRGDFTPEQCATPWWTISAYCIVMGLMVALVLYWKFVKRI